jgi:hypothetical protein
MAVLSPGATRCAVVESVWEMYLLFRGDSLLAVRMEPPPRFHPVREDLVMIRMSKLGMGLLALVFVLSLTVAAYAGDAKGKIKSVEADKKQFVLTDGNGKDWTLTLAKDAKVIINDKEATLADIKKGEEAEVTYDKKGDDLMASAIRVTRK